MSKSMNSTIQRTRRLLLSSLMRFRIKRIGMLIFPLRNQFQPNSTVRPVVATISATTPTYLHISISIKCVRWTLPITKRSIAFLKKWTLKRRKIVRCFLITTTNKPSKQRLSWTNWRKALNLSRFRDSRVYSICR